MILSRRVTIVSMLVAALAEAPDLKAETPAGPAGIMDSLFQVQPGRGMRVSSSDPDWLNGNGDARSKIKPGDTVTIAEIDGPGVIRHIWFTINAADPRCGRSLVLRMYWDKQEEPAVESPLGDFFAVGHGLRRCVNSLPVSVTSDGRAYNCYWPMPFAQHARITLTNEAKDKDYRLRSLYFYVDYEKVPALAPNTAYFHAQYRQEYPAQPGRNYLILDTEGQGQYVGTVLSVYSRTPGWFGEGDDFFYVDGETEPSIRGTGTEDYFSDAWGFREFNRPFYGVVVMEGYALGDRVSVYRWHIADPVRFNKSLKVEIEHKGEMDNEQGKTISGFYERADLFSSVAFWYQAGKAKRFATLPPAEQRVVPQKRIEFEDFVSLASSTPAGITMALHQGPFGQGNGLLAKCGEPTATITARFKSDRAVAGMARLTLNTMPQGGIWSVALDGKRIEGPHAVDTYSAEPDLREIRVGMVDLAPGEHSLTFECKGHNPVAEAYWLGVDALAVDAITPYLAKGEQEKR